MLTAVLAIGMLALLAGLGLGFAAEYLRADTDPVADRVHALLPQTQCGQCGYAGCRPYAEAIAADRANIDQCPPGGEATVVALAQLLDRNPKPVNSDYGEYQGKRVARIDEESCIGCALCLAACPVDAILGTAHHMHTVIAQACTGCELCLAPCPVDCIEMLPVEPVVAGMQMPPIIGRPDDAARSPAMPLD